MSSDTDDPNWSAAAVAAAAGAAAAAVATDSCLRASKNGGGP